MEIALIAPGRELSSWSNLIETKSGLRPQIWPEIACPDRVELVIAWRPPPGVFRQFRNLKLISSLGAGVDDILSDTQLPDVPIVRIVDPKLTQDMSNYLLMQVLNFHHDTWKYRENQRAHYWDPDRIPRPDWNVGVLGWGVLGKDLSQKLISLGYEVHAWQRHPEENKIVKTYGVPELGKLINKIDILINLLPLTNNTRAILNMQTFRQAAKPFYLINAARGLHLVENDLTEALDVGLIMGACLDVFSEEPLPRDHPFWADARIIVTPHIAGITNPHTAIDQILDNLKRMKNGQPLINQIMRTAGY